MRNKPRPTQHFPSDDAEPLRYCDAPGCTAQGVYRAPRARDDLRSYYMFCLDHVRQYNQSWDYFSGRSADEIEEQIRRDTVWDRPTWPLGGRTKPFWQKVQDAADAFRFFGTEQQTQHKHEESDWNLSSKEKEALRVLEMDPPFTRERLKARYKALVKRHHPDANGGDRAAEERLKEINQAYSTLKAAALP